MFLPALGFDTATDKPHDTANARDSLTKNYFARLTAAGFSGDCECSPAQRVVAATDNSIYRVIPKGIVYPRNEEDMRILMQELNNPEFAALSITGRGGGTGTSGSSLNSGIVVDCGRHMHQILDYDEESGRTRIQPGVVLDQLNAFLKTKGRFFAPMVSTSNRATLGGMFNTDAAGKGSRVYGKTSEHIAEAHTILHDASILHSRHLNATEFAEAQKEGGLSGAIYQAVYAATADYQAEIEQRFPKLDRFLTGYNLARVYDPTAGSCNLNYLLAGAEGTLGLTSELLVETLPLPQHSSLVVLEFASFEQALSSARFVLDEQPLAIETMDEEVMKVARADAVWSQSEEFWGRYIHPETATVSYVEFISDDLDELQRKLDHFCALMQTECNKGNLLRFYETKDQDQMTALWNIRKRGVGLLGKSEGPRQNIPFVEDCAVPPLHLSEFVGQFRQVLQDHGLGFGMFGHIDVGCLHIRPALDLRKDADLDLLYTITDKVNQLCHQYGGVIWGEHGKGFRGEHMLGYFGEVLYEQLRKIKTAFDPHNRFNPGKLVAPHGAAPALNSQEVPKRGHFDRHITPATEREYRTALGCNGNGVCQSYSTSDLMCPSYKALRDKAHSPKGRAELIKEWLHRLNVQGFEPRLANLPPEKLSVGTLLKKRKNAQKLKNGEYDYSAEVYDSLKECLSCKACSSLCPIRVDIPDFKSRFLSFYFTRYPRPLKDYAVALVERVAPAQSVFPRFSNAITALPPVRALTTGVLGLRDAPAASVPPLRSLLKKRRAVSALPKKWNKTTKETAVILVQDAFTSYYDAGVVDACCTVLAALGVQVYLSDCRENGKPLHIKGFLQRFARTAKKQADYLNTLAEESGLPLLGIEPSMTLIYQEEYPQIIGETVPVRQIQDWLAGYIRQGKTDKLALQPQDFTYLGHCSQRSSRPSSTSEWKYIFETMGHRFKAIPVGCCGMAGTYGHETEHYTTSKQIYSLSWQTPVETCPPEHTLIADGYSCRSQIKRFAPHSSSGNARRALHPLEALAQTLPKISPKASPKVSLEVPPKGTVKVENKR